MKPNVNFKEIIISVDREIQDNPVVITTKITLEIDGKNEVYVCETMTQWYETGEWTTEDFKHRLYLPYNSKVIGEVKFPKINE